MSTDVKLDVVADVDKVIYVTKQLSFHVDYKNRYTVMISEVKFFEGVRDQRLALYKLSSQSLDSQGCRNSWDVGTCALPFFGGFVTKCPTTF